jgi:CBS domain-containing protein
MPARPVSEVIGKRPIPAAGLSACVGDAASIMKRYRTSAVLVVDEGILRGIFTERDLACRVIAERLDPQQTRLDAVMTRKMRTITPEKPFGHALHLMFEGGFRHVPVVDRAGHPLGVVAAHDALAMDSLLLGEELVRREEISVIL